MDTCGWGDEFAAVGVGHLADLVSKGTGAVDDHFAVNVKLFLLDRVANLYPVHEAVTVLDDADHLAVVRNRRALHALHVAVHRCRQRQLDVHAAVVVLAVVIHKGALKAFRLEEGEQKEGVGSAGVEALGEACVEAADELGEPVVGLDARVEVRHLPPVVDGHDDGQRLGHERRALHHVRTLLQRLPHQIQLADIKVLECGLEVPHPAMQELGGPAGGA
mmetsp:Transcript_127/g.347  ORF Transcript_127/g.347 Transcript_127/m.347 type:complete len:219 (-) Transcript_127:219-875(-)